MQVRNPLPIHDKNLHSDIAVPAAFINVANGIVGLDASSKIPSVYLAPKIGSFSRVLTDANGNQAITGVGFRPSAVLFFAATTSTTQISFGLDDGNAQVRRINYDATAAVWLSNTAGDSIRLVAQAGVTETVGAIETMDADGFTISWLKTGSPTGTAHVNYVAFR